MCNRLHTNQMAHFDENDARVRLGQEVADPTQGTDTITHWRRKCTGIMVQRVFKSEG
jgi:hypothetical protein